MKNTGARARRQVGVYVEFCERKKEAAPRGRVTFKRTYFAKRTRVGTMA